MSASGLISAIVSLLNGIEGFAQVLPEGHSWPSSFPAARVEIAKLSGASPQELGEAELLNTTVTVSVINHLSSPDGASSVRDQALELTLELRKKILADPSLGGTALNAIPSEAQLNWQTHEEQEYVVIVTKILATTVES